MDLRPNLRISHGPSKGTIRYIGPVAPSTGLWLGIEWDDPTRGKHSGTSADGTRYFDVRIPGSGSFVRPTSTKLSSGCCFVEALRNRYDPSATEEVKKTEEGRHYSRKNIAEIEIETPNLERVARKAARLDRLKEVGLDGQTGVEQDGDEARYEVARAFDEAKRFGPGSIRATCPNIRWLDLSRSLLPDWEEVSLIAGELEQLRTLVLRFNRLQSPPAEVPTSWEQRLGHLQDLRLDGTLLQWDDVVRLAPALTGLKILHLGSNELASLAKPPPASTGFKEGETIFPSLTHLSLEDNALSSWAELVASLAPLPSLETLILDRNRITDIPPAPPSACKLPRLKEVHLRGNPVRSWSSLEHIPGWLGAETRLEALHISTLQDDDEASSSTKANETKDDLLSRYEYRDFRALAIARLATLTVLDKTEITPKERRDAELFTYTRIRDGDAYILRGGLSRLGTEEKLPLSEPEKVAIFPRFLELGKAFGEDKHTTDSKTEGGQQGGKGKSTLRSKMLSLSVVACDAPPRLTPPHLVGAVVAQREAVQVLASTPLRLCKSKLASAVGVKVGSVGAVWALMKQRSGEEGERIVLEIDDMSRSLNWYEVASGDTLVLVVEA